MSKEKIFFFVKQHKPRNASLEFVEFQDFASGGAAAFAFALVEEEVGADQRKLKSCEQLTRDLDSCLGFLAT